MTRKILKEIGHERWRQVKREHWSHRHDDLHEEGTLATGGVSYALRAFSPKSSVVPRDWPWHSMWWKPKTPRRNLIKAAALIVAEIERLDRETQETK